MLVEAFPTSLDYHLSKLVTYPFFEGPIKWSGSADAKAVRKGIDEFEKQIKKQEGYTTPYIGDIESVRAAIDKLISYYDNKGEGLDPHTAYALGYAAELDRAS